MSFIHPLLLAGLAVAALPIIIHLINQWRYQTIRWGAMMFLLAANRMSRGFARLRQWLILLMRVLAIACLVFVIARPLAGGWLALTAGGADTTIVLLDRSPSMAEQDSGSGQTKLAAGRRQLADALGHLRSSRWILIESTSNQPRELESPAALAQLAEAGPASASADLPAMLSAARDYMTANQTGRTEIWICSDLRANDWNADDARWETLRSAFAGLAQSVRINLLALAQTAPANLSIATTRVRRRETDDGAELLVSLRVEREGSTERPVSVPIQFDIEGIKSVVNAEFAGSEFELRDHRIPLGHARPHSRLSLRESSEASGTSPAVHADFRGAKDDNGGAKGNVLSQGWGRVSLPADANLADNDSYFVFSEADEQRSVIIADEPAVAEALRLAASVPVDPAERSAAAIIDLDQLATIEWDKTALVLWQAPLPKGQTARQLEVFVDRGGQVIFFPPRQTGEMEIFGAGWGEWHEISDAGASAVDGWRGDEDLLANTQSGQALPVGELKVRNVCSLSGEVTPLATLVAGQPLLARAVTPRGGVYFCATTPAPADSSLAGDGVVLYVAVQRALAAGAAALGGARQMTAGRVIGDTSDWRRVAGDENVLSTEYAYQSGVYASGDALVAVNRSEGEDGAELLADERLAGLFRGLDFSRTDADTASTSPLIQEIWRSFLAAMMAALVIEAWLCLPRRMRTTSEPPVAIRPAPVAA